MRAVEHYSATTKEDILPVGTVRMDLQHSVLGKKSQTEHLVLRVARTWNLKKLNVLKNKQ